MIFQIILSSQSDRDLSKDFPIPDGLDPESVCQKIKQGLGFPGDVSFSPYYGDKTFPDVVLNKYSYAGITLHSHVCKCTRLNHMILDILLWKLDNDPDYFHPINLVVISRNISKDTVFNNVLQGFHCSSTDYNVVVVLHDHLLMRLIEDIVWWARIKRDYIGTGIPQNVLVISKSIPEDTLLVKALEAMKKKRFNILLAQHDEHDDSDKALAIANDVWVWETLFDGGEPLGPYVTDSEEESSHGAKRFKTDADSDDKCI
ncbi:hypothetical protein ISN44_As10g028590 [Arabidopsis suecica]|uniref:Uncharacterized protein n=1 Tax=Arabidopsis suecica TaxID=45249 RepID=A0A8T2A015_ARASU|nr:hypothetical protein ISN44_As10g028590 [Arabidopsis suecica]